MRATRWTLAALLAGLSWNVGLAGEWPQFRGPNNAGVSDSAGYPAEWGVDDHIAWKVSVPGVSWSCPVVWGDKVFLTTAVTDKQEKPRAGFGGGGFGRGGGGGGEGREGRGGAERGGDGERRAESPNDEERREPERPEGGRGPGRFGRPGGGGGFGPGGFGRGGGQPPNDVYRWEVHCLSRTTGETLWKQVAREGKPSIPIHRTNTYATETPVIDGQHVYVYFGMHGVFCYDLDGKLAWKKDLGSYPMQLGYGTGSSPALEGDRLFILCDNERDSFLVALDKRTGEELWRTKREERSSWGTPFVWKTEKRTEIVAGGRKVRSYDPATGKLLWELGGLQSTYNSTPVAGDGLLYVGAGGGMQGSGPLFAVKAGASGDITLKEGATSNDGIAWSRARSGPSMASPLLYQGHLYVLEQRGGMVSCFDAKTGEPAYYRKRINGAQGFTASPWAYDGKVFCLDDNGQTTVLKAGAEYEVLGQNKVGEMTWASPALADGALFLRGVDHLFCIK